MEEKYAELHNKGMWQDNAISKSPDGFAYKNRNIRISLSNDGTQLAVTNEMDTGRAVSISGVYLGGCTISDYYVVFTKIEATKYYESKDIITLVDFSKENPATTVLYEGNLGFDVNHKIECLPWYESEDIQKIYWIDGLNQTRVINIKGDIASDDDTQFDFKTSITSIPKVEIHKDYSIPGMFSQGTVQYFVTYYRKFGSESGIIWQSSLQYVSYKDRGAKADENVSVSFDISIHDFDRNFDYIRVYSAYRSTYNGPISLRIVGDIEIPSDSSVKNVNITDTGTGGYEIDSSMLQFIGGQDVVAETITQKDGVMFLGNVDINSGNSGDSFNSMKEYIDGTIKNIDSTDSELIRESSIITFETKTINYGTPKGYYYHEQQINRSEYNIKTFKRNEIYRFALQFMDRKCVWSTPIWCGDLKCEISPSYDSKKNKIFVASAVVIKNSHKALMSKMNELGYIAYRILCAETSYATRSVVAQGVVSPTLFNYNDRFNNKPFAFSSWNFRPRKSSINSTHLQSIGSQDKEYAELQGLKEEKSPIVDIIELEKNKYEYYSLIMGFDGGHEIQFRLVFFNANNDELLNVLKGTGGISDYVSIIKTADKGYINKTKWGDAINEAYDRMQNSYVDDTHTKEDFPLSRNTVPSVSTIKAIIATLSIKSFSEFMKIFVSGALILKGVFDVVGTSIAILFDYISNMKEWNVKKAVAAMAIVGGNTVRKAKDSARNNLERLMASYGWVYVGENKDVKKNYSSLFKNGDVPDFVNFKGTNNGSFWITGGKLSTIKADQEEAEKRTEQFYVDENIVTLNSPDIEGNEDMINDNQSLKLRVVGKADIDSTYGGYTIETSTSGFAVSSGVISSNSEYNSTIGEAYKNGMLSGYLYQDSILLSKESQLPSDNYDRYKVFLWNRETSLSLGGGIPNTASDLSGLSKLKRKLFANIRYSICTEYTENKTYVPDYNILTPKVYNDDDSTLIINNGQNDVYYTGGYDNIVSFIQKNKYPVITENSDSILSDESMYITDPVRIKFRSTQHAVMALGRTKIEMNILPRCYGDTDKDLKGVYSNRYKSLFNTEVGYDNASKGIIEDSFVFIKDITTAIRPVSLVDVDGCEVSCNEGEYLINIEYGSDAYKKIFEVIINNIRDDNDKKAEGITSDDVVMLLYNLNTGGKYIMIPTVVKTTDGIKINCYVSVICMSKIGTEYEMFTLSQLDSLLVRKYNVYLSQTIESKNVENHISPYGSDLNYTYIIDKNYSFEFGCLKLFRYNSIIKDRIFGDKSSNNPYLLIGELYRDLKYSTLYGGYSDDAMKNIRWNICSSNTNASEEIHCSWGDTYYQRWDCLKSYPKTEEDTNGIVDIFSFMVESRKNLDGRCDINRGISNILNARPSNWNLMNDSYSQNGNIFTYSILDSKFNASKYKNQIIWSSKKTDLSDIDSWTNINTISALSLDGKYGKITKLDNVNNTIIAFQEDAVSSIRFNARTQLSTEQGLPVEVANSGKVDGYDIITDTSGCMSKNQECKGSSGVYFVDSKRNSMMKLSKEGIVNLGINYGMSTFFTSNAKNVDRIFYDSITNDVYIVGKYDSGLKYCMNYNELTSSFVSFLPYINSESSVCMNGQSYIVNPSSLMTYIDRMFIGKYSSSFSMSFRVNQEPYIDKIFTTVDYVADVFDSEGKYMYNINPIEAIGVETEYQKGETEIPQFNRSAFRGSDMRKFRIRRIQIPRDSNSRYGLDRIRNPWCMISFLGNPKNKMVFHEGFVRYFR